MQAEVGAIRAGGCPAQNAAVAPPALELRQGERERAPAQPGGRHAKVGGSRRRDAGPVPEQGAAAAVQDGAGDPRGGVRLLASGRQAAPRGEPEVPERGKAQAQPQRLERLGQVPAAGVAGQQDGGGERGRGLSSDCGPHLRKPLQDRARNDTVQKDMCQGLASAGTGSMRAPTLVRRGMVPNVTSKHPDP